MCGSPKIPAQDPRFADAALRQIQLAERQYADYIAPGGERDYMRELGDEAIGLYRNSEQRATQMHDYQLEQMRGHDRRYWDVTAPYEDEVRRDVNHMNTEAYREDQVGRARADVQQSFDASERQAGRALTRMGLSPSSGAYAKMLADGGRSKALAMVAASAKVRQAAIQAGLANKMQVLGGMKGMAGLGGTAAQLAISANGQGQGAAAGIPGTQAGVIDTNNRAFGTYSGGVAQGLSGYNGYYANSLQGAQIRAQNDPGNMILGTIVGVGSRYAMGKIG